MRRHKNAHHIYSGYLFVHVKCTAAVIIPFDRALLSKVVTGQTTVALTTVEWQLGVWCRDCLLFVKLFLEFCPVFTQGESRNSGGQASL